MVGRGVLARVLAAAAAAAMLLGLGSLSALAYNSDPSGPAAPAAVDNVGPVGDSVPTGTAITVSFTAPVDEATVVLTIRPSVRGVMRWVDDQTLQFEPASLQHGASYQVIVQGRSAEGRLVRGKRVWGFTTDAGPPIVLSPGPASVRVPILMYHYIRLNPDPRDRLGYALSVTPTDFAAQMDWLAANGYHTVTMRDLVDYLSGARGLPSKPIVLTFDDGYADFFTTALPILRSHEFTAVSYVVTGFIGWARYMSADQIVAAQDYGVEIGSHTVGHVNLTMQSPGALMEQLVASKAALEALLGRPVVSFCYPSGRFGAREMAAVQAAGYQNATTTMGGTWHSLRDRFAWTRVRVSGGVYLSDFAAAVQFGA
ncbi:MAG: polysaccharide deacetylase family protein [Candidatus Dormibacterales bacterium]